MIASAAGLMFVNISDLVSTWKKGVRIMAYVADNTSDTDIAEGMKRIRGMSGVEEVLFISRHEAMEMLKKQMSRQSGILENLDSNPLPDAFEIKMKPDGQSWVKIETLAAHIELVKIVTDVEYGQAWLGRMTKIFSLFQFIGAAVFFLFFFVIIFIVANTIRLALYSRREEIEIMRLVGATDGFIKGPSYIIAVIQGAAGGILGLIALYLSYLAVTINIEQNFSTYAVNIRFLPAKLNAGLILYSIFVGWVGCFVSLKQFLKKY
jgi:cell division transport system permease protein